MSDPLRRDDPPTAPTDRAEGADGPATTPPGDPDAPLAAADTAPDPADLAVAEDHDAVTLAEIDQAAALVGARTERIVEDLIQTELATGRREETVEQAERHIIFRIARVAAGVVVLIIGIVLLAAPGPGLLVIALGLGLLAQDVPFARNLLDRVRERLPQDADGKLPRSTVIGMVVVGVGAVAISIGFTVWRMGAA